MELIKVAVLAIIQGLTEFLPVSSSGHLALMKKIFGFSGTDITLDVFLHFGTLLSVVVVFREDIKKLICGFFTSLNFQRKERNIYEKLVWLIIIANIPAGVVGILFKDRLEQIFGNYLVVCGCLIFTGIVLFASKLFRDNKLTLKEISITKAFIIGCAQMVAILPGISRSGMSISAGLFCKLNREIAARFSFLIMLPAVGGAALLESRHFGEMGLDIYIMLIGVLLAFVTGYMAILLLLKMVRNYSLHYFSYYCIGIGIAGIVIHFIM